LIFVLKDYFYLCMYEVGLEIPKKVFKKRI
jgi:hypothetical protein